MTLADCLMSILDRTDHSFTAHKHRVLLVRHRGLRLGLRMRRRWGFLLVSTKNGHQSWLYKDLCSVNPTWRQMDHSIIDSHLVPQIVAAKRYGGHSVFVMNIVILDFCNHCWISPELATLGLAPHEKKVYVRPHPLRNRFQFPNFLFLGYRVSPQTVT